MSEVRNSDISEALPRRDDILWIDKEKETVISYPENPLVPQSEGIHLRIVSENVPLHPKTSEDWQGWLRHWAKAIGAGKVISEGRALPDMWQSFIGRTEFSSQQGLTTEVIGRNPHAESWGKTAPLPDDENYDHRGEQIEPKKLKEVKEVLDRYFKTHWIPELSKVRLFEEPLAIDSPESQAFKEKDRANNSLDYPWQSQVLFKSDIADVAYIRHPHLASGIHYMIGVAYAPRRPWRDLNRSLQGLAIAESVSQLLEETEYNGEPLAAWTSVRTTGSWFGGFKNLLEEPAFLDPNTPAKMLKRFHRGARTKRDPKNLKRGDQRGDDWQMNFHPHVYGAKRPGDPIQLTKRPRHEGGADWEGIEELPLDERMFFRGVLNARLSAMLQTIPQSIVS